jgi:hypothetical protein
MLTIVLCGSLQYAGVIDHFYEDLQLCQLNLNSRELCLMSPNLKTLPPSPRGVLRTAYFTPWTIFSFEKSKGKALVDFAYRLLK